MNELIALTGAAAAPPLEGAARAPHDNGGTAKDGDNVCDFVSTCSPSSRNNGGV